MKKGRVLIIEDEEWEATLLRKFLGDAGYEVYSASEAQDGFAKACALLPDCIVCDVVLPDVDGFWVARRLRTEPSSVASTPIVFLTALDDAAARLQALNVGADVFLTKPFRGDEVVAQVNALISLMARVREQRDRESLISGPASSGRLALRGDLAEMSLGTLLTMLEMERRSGRLKVRNLASDTASFQLEEGFLTTAALDGQDLIPVEVLRAVLKWTGGKFAFSSAPPEGIDMSQRSSIGALLLEALRLEDESRR